MALVSILIDYGLEQLYQIGRRDHLVTEAPDKLDSARINDRCIRNIIEGRILHRDRLRIAEDLLQSLVKFYPGMIVDLLAGK